MTIQKYGDRAKDFLDAWPETQRLWQVQLTHDAAPSYLIHIVEAFNRYLSSLHEADPENPKDLVALKKDCNVVLQITHVESNAQGAPLVNWRVAFYVVGNKDALREFVILFHGYTKFRALYPLASDRRAFAELAEQRIVLHLGSGADVGEVTSLTEPSVELADVALGLPCKILDCAGPSGNKFLRADIEIVDAEHVAIGFTGRTWLLREAFDAAEIPLAIEDGVEATRFINGDAGHVANEATKATLLSIFNDGVLHNGACLVIIANDGDVDEDAPSFRFVSELRRCAHLGFL